MSTVNAEEVRKFSLQASHWWDEEGPFSPLHALNPVRLSFIRQGCLERYGTVQGLKILDIGCGGGLLTEPLCRLGAQVTGLEASAEALEVAQTHARAQNLSITYLQGSLEDLHTLSSQNTPPHTHMQTQTQTHPHADTPKDTHTNTNTETNTETGSTGSPSFHVITALEILEHVDHWATFIQKAIGFLEPGGLFFFSTLNRTGLSWLLGKVAAEYVLRWVPAGTHQWKKFLKPSEVSHCLHTHGYAVQKLQGMTYKPLRRQWALTSDLSINYIGMASPQAKAP